MRHCNQGLQSYEAKDMPEEDDHNPKDDADDNLVCFICMQGDF